MIWCGLYLLQGGGLHGCRALSERGGRTGARGGGKLLPVRAAGLIWARLHICLWGKRRLLINVCHSVSKKMKKHKWQMSDRIPHHVTEQHHTWFSTTLTAECGAEKLQFTWPMHFDLLLINDKYDFFFLITHYRFQLFSVWSLRAVKSPGLGKLAFFSIYWCFIN